MPTKICTKCGEDKELGEYSKSKLGKFGRASACKGCRAMYRAVNKEKFAEYQAKYYEANKDKIAEHKAKHYEANKDKIAEYGAKYYEANKEKKAEHNAKYRAANRDKIAEHKAKHYEANKDKIAEYKAKYYEANKDKIAEYSAKYMRRRRKTDPAFALTGRTRRSVRRTLNGTISGSYRHLPYTPQQLYDHLLTTLPEGYTEADICDGSKLHIDHIRPVSSFSLTGEIDDEFHKCWALSNLQLLPAKENIRKGASTDHLNTYQMELQL